MAETAEAVENQTQEQTEQGDSKTQAQSVELSEAVENKTAGPNASIDILLDMNVSITVTIGKTKVPIQRLLQLGPGSVLTLDKPIDAPADLYLKGTIFATGNVVVVEDRFAIKIKEVLSPEAVEAANN